MKRLADLAPWLLQVLGLVPILAVAAFVGVLVGYRDAPGLDPQVYSVALLLEAIVYSAPPAVCFASVAAAIGLGSGASWARRLGLGASSLLALGAAIGLVKTEALQGLSAVATPAALHILGPGAFGLQLAAVQGPLAGLAVVSLVARRRRGDTFGEGQSDRYAPRGLERRVGAFIMGLAIGHAVLAAVVLGGPITGQEGGIVTSAPVFVSTGLGVGWGVLQGRRWARPPLVVATLPILLWTLYVANTFAGYASARQWLADGVVLVLGVMLAFAALVAAMALRRFAPPDL